MPTRRRRIRILYPPSFFWCLFSLASFFFFIFFIVASFFLFTSFFPHPHPNLSKIVRTCLKWSKIVQNHPKLSKISEIFQNFIKLFDDGLQCEFIRTLLGNHFIEQFNSTFFCTHSIGKNVVDSALCRGILSLAHFITRKMSKRLLHSYYTARHLGMCCLVQRKLHLHLLRCQSGLSLIVLYHHLTILSK